MGVGLSGCLVPGQFVDQKYASWFNAARLGRPGDRVAAPNYEPLYGSLGYGHDHAVCVNALDTSGNLVTYWGCVGPGVWYFMGFDQSRLLRGIIRNNTTGDTNHITGKQSWFVRY